MNHIERFATSIIFIMSKAFFAREALNPMEGVKSASLSEYPFFRFLRFMPFEG